MIEVLVGLIGFAILALVSWWADKNKKARDYYDGDNVG